MMYKNKLKLLLLVFVGLIIPAIVLAIPPSGYVKLKDGILIKIGNENKKGAKVLKVQVVTDNMLHITASPVDSFTIEKSLMVMEIDRPSVKWNVKEKNGVITLSTSLLNAAITEATGEISFTDKNGKLLLQEKIP